MMGNWYREDMWEDIHERLSVLIHFLLLSQNIGVQIIYKERRVFLFHIFMCM